MFSKDFFTPWENISFELYEIGCVDPSIVASMVNFMVSHTPWNLQPNSIPKTQLLKLIEVLNEKIKMEI